MAYTRPLSHSSITLYTECPQKWKFKYIDKIPEKPKYFFSFGKSVHSALEFFYNVAALPAPALKEVLAHYKKNWISEGYKDAAREAESFAEGEQILKEFYDKHIETFLPPFFAEYRFDLKVDGIPVTGFVDRIDKVDGGKIAIVDYKTGKAIPKDRVKADAQLTMYQMACEELLGLKVDSLTLYHLPSQTALTTQAHSKDLVKELRSRVVSVAGSIAKEEFEPKPEERKCMWCDYKPFCPVFKDSQAAPLLAAASAAMSRESGDENARQPEVAELVDRLGRLREDISKLEREAGAVEAQLSATLQQKGWVKAFGAQYEATLATEEKWEFVDKAKVLDAIKRAGRWADILAPSAPLVYKLIGDASTPYDLQNRLKALGQKVTRFTLQVEKTSAEPAVLS